MKGFLVSAGAVILVPVILIAAVIFLGDGAHSSSVSAACGGTGNVSAAVDKVPDKIGSWDHAQLEVAKTLIDTAQKAGASTQATVILVMAAMGESSLTDLDHGDAVDNSTVGVLQQGSSYGTRDQRMDVATAARAFLTRLQKVADWQDLPPTIAAHMVQGNADPNHYTPWYADAQEVVAALTGDSAAGTCTISTDQTALAKTLADAWRASSFTDTYHPQMVEQEILPLADGTGVKPGCQVDTRVLQLLVAALQTYGSVQISDLNRPCVGVTTDCGFSLHCVNPDRAVDFNAIGGRVVTGDDIQFLQWLDSVLPKGSEFGQSQCRPAQTFANVTQFSDACTHQHVDLGQTSAALNITLSIASPTATATPTE